MTTPDNNLRKAAVFLRSLDSDTAAIMLAQLSREEATAIRAAMRDLGSIDADEEADVAAEFRRTRPAMATHSVGGVELEFSSQSIAGDQSPGNEIASQSNSSGRRFEFLANASPSELVPYLAREHAQTIAVILSHLTPSRAAAVLAALPEKVQAATVERLAALGETDPESVSVLERELAAWMASRGENRGALARRRETVTNILAAADAKTRRGILHQLRSHNVALAEQFDPRDRVGSIPVESQNRTIDRDTSQAVTTPDPSRSRHVSKQASDTTARIRQRLVSASRPITVVRTPSAPPAPQLPQIEFDQLIHLDEPALNALLREVDAGVLALALVGSQEEFVDRICAQLPKHTGRTFRRELRKIGPTRLSDVEAAQRAVADTAARHLLARRR